MGKLAIVQLVKRVCMGVWGGYILKRSTLKMVDEGDEAECYLLGCDRAGWHEWKPDMPPSPITPLITCQTCAPQFYLCIFYIYALPLAISQYVIPTRRLKHSAPLKPLSTRGKANCYGECHLTRGPWENDLTRQRYSSGKVKELFFYLLNNGLEKRIAIG